MAPSATLEISKTNTASDYSAIVTTLHTQRIASRITTRSHYKEKTVSILLFKTSLEGMDDLEHEDAVMTKVKKACDASMQFSKSSKGRRPVYWGNQ